MKIKILMVVLAVSVAFNAGFVVKALQAPTLPHEGHEVQGTHEAHGSQVDAHVMTASHDNWKKSSQCLQLKLANGQIKHMESCRNDFQKNITPLKKKLREEREKLFKLLQAETLDQKGSNVILERMASLQTEIQKHFIRHFFDVKTTMDEKQQEKFFFYVDQCLHNSEGCGVTPGKHQEKHSCGVEKKDCKSTKMVMMKYP